MTTNTSFYCRISSSLTILLFLNSQLSPGLSSGDVRIPVIDIQPIMDSGNPSYHLTALAIHKSFRKYGIFIGLGQFLNSAADTGETHSAKRLFALPLEEKLAAKMNDSESFGRGYIAFGEEAGSYNFQIVSK
jgi:isopenicillin N synthase-like dioxygenase